MSILYFHQSNGIYFDEIINQVDIHRPNKVVILGETEWEVAKINKDFIDQLKSRNVELHMIHCSFRCEYYEKLYSDIGLPIENVHFYNTYWFNSSYNSLIGSGLRPETYIARRQFKHKFISMNNRSHIHRCAFIDEMAKQDLIDKGVVSWIKHLNENSDYPYKYFDNRQLLLSDDFVTKLDSFLIPDEYHDSLLDVVTEATTVVDLISEKTATPILLKKPFLVLSSRGFYKRLAELGFKLYDEVFDYAFDDEPDLLKRTEMFVKNLHVIDRYDLTALYDELYPKIYHNYENACRLIMDKSLIPNHLLDYKNKYPESGPATTITQFLSNTIQKTKRMSIWKNDQDTSLTDIDNTHNGINRIIIDQTVECQYDVLPGLEDGVQKVIHKCRQYGIPVTLLTASYKYNTPLVNDLDGVEIVDNPGFWLAKTLSTAVLHRWYEANKRNQLDIVKPVTLPCDTLYITMNNLIKFHRCRMMDMLSKYDLIDKGNIAWRDVSRAFDDKRPLPDNISESILLGYQFEYWAPKKMFLDIPDNGTSFVEQDLIPTQYSTSFMQLVTESEDELFILSEKTAMPLFFKKPFLVASSKNFHRNLSDMGFELYDEVFDYDFDSIDDMPSRIEMLVKEVNKLRDHSMEQLNELRVLLEPKLAHNRQLAKQYASNVAKQFKPYNDILLNNNIFTQLDSITDLDAIIPTMD